MLTIWHKTIIYILCNNRECVWCSACLPSNRSTIWTFSVLINWNSIPTFPGFHHILQFTSQFFKLPRKLYKMPSLSIESSEPSLKAALNAKKLSDGQRWVFLATFINYAMAHWTRKYAKLSTFIFTMLVLYYILLLIFMLGLTRM